MVLNIKDPETDRLARELTHLTGETITTATREALRERLRRMQGRSHTPAARFTLTEIIASARAEASTDPRPAEEILGYDSDGLPS